MRRGALRRGGRGESGIMAEGKGRTFIVGSIDQMLLLPSWSTEMPRRPEVGVESSDMRKGESRDTCPSGRARARVSLSGKIATDRAIRDRASIPRTARRGAREQRSAAPARTRRPEPRRR